jgi:hypothetical protein
LSNGGNDDDGGSEDSIGFPESPAASQSNDPDILTIMEHMEEPVSGDSDEEDASGEEAPEEEDDDNEEEEYEELMVPLAPVPW